MDAVVGLFGIAILLGGWFASATGIEYVLRMLDFPGWFIAALSVSVGLCCGMALQILLATALMRSGDKDWMKSETHGDNMRWLRRTGVAAVSITAAAIPLQLIVGQYRFGAWVEAIVVGGCTIAAGIAADRCLLRRPDFAQPRAPSDPPKAGS